MYLLSAQADPVAVAAAAAPVAPAATPLSPLKALALHWQEYAMEAAGLGFFMISACLCGALYENLASPVRQALAWPLLRRMLMGLSMGLTAVVIIYSPWGKQSGAHINPSVTLTFFRLGKMQKWDAIFYVVAQFAGAVLGVMLVALLLGKAIADPNVRYVVTVPGKAGATVAFAAEFLMAFGMMLLVLHLSNHHRLSRFTGFFAGLLVATYITLAAPLSGMSMNPARTFSSALPAGIFTAIWGYFIAPPLGMLCAAEVYLWRKGKSAVGCCKLHHDNPRRCIFCGANRGFAV
jgi:aquaporin Z